MRLFPDKCSEQSEEHEESVPAHLLSLGKESKQRNYRATFLYLLKKG
jgi:hypothetical protein